MREVTSLGNEGFRIRAGKATIFVDAFYFSIPGVAAAPAWRAARVDRADLILVTHAHGDHFDADQVADVAGRTGAWVAGPEGVARGLAGRVRPDRLVALEPAEAGSGKSAQAVRKTLPAADVTAFRTFHGRQHNSYLVEAGGFRFFHDGDNENTRPIPAARLGRLDALLIGPWQGAGWVEFIEATRPVRWFLMHLTEEELDAHAAGEFLPELCDRVPPGLVALRPGESFAFPDAAGHA